MFIEGLILLSDLLELQSAVESLSNTVTELQDQLAGTFTILIG